MKNYIDTILEEYLEEFEENSDRYFNMKVILESALTDLLYKVQEECVPEERIERDEPSGCECGGDSEGQVTREINEFRQTIINKLDNLRK